MVVSRLRRWPTCWEWSAKNENGNGDEGRNIVIITVAANENVSKTAANMTLWSHLNSYTFWKGRIPNNLFINIIIKSYFITLPPPLSVSQIRNRCPSSSSLIRVTSAPRITVFDNCLKRGNFKIQEGQMTSQLSPSAHQFKTSVNSDGWIFLIKIDIVGSSICISPMAIFIHGKAFQNPLNHFLKCPTPLPFHSLCPGGSQTWALLHFQLKPKKDWQCLLPHVSFNRWQQHEYLSSDCV